MILVLCSLGEWCRGEVMSWSPERDTARVFFTDHDHSGEVPARGLRWLDEEDRRGPVGVRRVVFLEPGNRELMVLVRQGVGKTVINVSQLVISIFIGLVIVSIDDFILNTCVR